MQKATLLVALGFSLMMVAPSAVAVHGEAYDAYGTATGPAGVFLAHVAWLGYASWGDPDCAGGFGCYVVDLKDVATGAVVSHEKFAGNWNANGPVIYFFEILNYHGWAVDGSAHFDIKGFQGQQVTGGAPQKAIMFYTGNYHDLVLNLVVPYGVYL